MRKALCLHCNKPTVWADNPWRPFCSERCKMIDLGHWLVGDYSIPGEPQSAEEPKPDEPNPGDGDVKLTLH